MLVSTLDSACKFGEFLFCVGDPVFNVYLESYLTGAMLPQNRAQALLTIGGVKCVDVLIAFFTIYRRGNGDLARVGIIVVCAVALPVTGMLTTTAKIRHRILAVVVTVSSPTARDVLMSTAAEFSSLSAWKCCSFR